MTLMSPLRAFTTKVFNPIFRRVAAWVPGFAVLEYVGRKSGRTYRIPVMRFRRESGYVLCLVYGPNVEWVKNVAGGGRRPDPHPAPDDGLTDPEVVVDPSRRLLPRYARPLMRLLRVKAFMTLRAVSDP